MQDINNGGLNFLDYLKKISPEDILRKQKAIEIIAPTLQYSVIPENVGNGDDCKTWKSPFRDAADVIIEKILDKKTVEPIDGFSDEELFEQHERQNDIMDYHDDYAALRSVTESKKAKPVTEYNNLENSKKKKRATRGLATISKIILTETDPNPPSPPPIPAACQNLDISDNNILAKKMIEQQESTTEDMTTEFASRFI